MFIKFKKIIHYLFHLFFPRLCNGCNGLLVQYEEVICTHCRHELPLTDFHLLKTNPLEQKFFGLLPIEFASAMTFFHNKGIVQQLIHNLKYKNQQEIGFVLGSWYAQELKTCKRFPNIDYIIPTPLHPKRYKKRGYNQIHTFCEALSKEFNTPIATDVLFRKKYSISQTKKSRDKRSAVLSNVFEPTSNAFYENKHFLLVDDVITSGATIESCSKALLEIPNCKVSILAIAYTES